MTDAEIAATVRSLREEPQQPVVLDRLTRLAACAAGATHVCLLVRDRSDPRTAIAVAGVGFDDDLIGRRVGADEGAVGEVLRSGRRAAAVGWQALPPVLGARAASAAERRVGGVVVPVVAEGTVHGALAALRPGGPRGLQGAPGRVLDAAAEVAGAALEHLGDRDHGLATVRARVQALAAALDLRDAETGRHVAEVVGLARRVGERIGLSLGALLELEFAAQLHDVGKIGVPDPVLHKPGPLEPWEARLMREHPVRGAAMLAGIPGLEAVAMVVRFHHERWDGRGYPDGLRGERIPLASRILAVCDAFHAITADRPYRGGRSAEAALAELRRCAGSQFDPDVVEAFAGSGAWLGAAEAAPARLAATG